MCVCVGLFVCFMGEGLRIFLCTSLYYTKYTCINIPGRKQSLVKHGRIDIVQCLRDLPPTKNHLTNFNVDVMRATV